MYRCRFIGDGGGEQAVHGNAWRRTWTTTAKSTGVYSDAWSAPAGLIRRRRPFPGKRAMRSVYHCDITHGAVTRCPCITLLCRVRQGASLARHAVAVAIATADHRSSVASRRWLHESWYLHPVRHRLFLFCWPAHQLYHRRHRLCTGQWV